MSSRLFGGLNFFFRFVGRRNQERRTWHAKNLRKFFNRCQAVIEISLENLGDSGWFPAALASQLPLGPTSFFHLSSHIGGKSFRHRFCGHVDTHVD